MTGAMVTVGVDVASQPAGTAACHVRWERRGAIVEAVEHEVNDRRLAEILAAPVDKIGLDVPLGWPDDFVAAVGQHHAGRSFGEARPERLARRETDRWVHEQIRQQPLSVSTDRIAYPAMRMARLMGQLVGEPVDRSGAGKFVEVYPAAALRQWGLPHRGYKAEVGRPVLTALIEDLRARCPWLRAGAAGWADVIHTDHTFDALVCALVARAQERDLCCAIPDELHDAATREGWIAIPVPGSLDHLTVGGAVSFQGG